VNGLIANDADEFAGAVCELWNDAALRRRLGEAARDTVAAEFSQKRLVNQLSGILNGD
jgi:glycosyltransferase involved in cell wall biosynthesis